MEKISDATLQIIEILTNRVGVALGERSGRETLSEDLEDVGVVFDDLIDAAEFQQSQVGERLLDLAVASVIAVASMVAGAKQKQQEASAKDLEIVQAELQERAAKSGIIISSMDQFD